METSENTSTAPKNTKTIGLSSSGWSTLKSGLLKAGYLAKTGFSKTAKVAKVGVKKYKGSKLNKGLSKGFSAAYKKTKQGASFTLKKTKQGAQVVIDKAKTTKVGGVMVNAASKTKNGMVKAIKTVKRAGGFADTPAEYDENNEVGGFVGAQKVAKDPFQEADAIDQYNLENPMANPPGETFADEETGEGGETIEGDEEGAEDDAEGGDAGVGSHDVNPYM